MFDLKRLLDMEEMIDINSLDCDEKSIELIKEFIDDYKLKAKRLEKILKISDKQQLEIVKLNESLKKNKNDLERLYKSEQEKNRLKEQLLIEQSKHAAMGQMIDSVAHQWSQPLSVIQLLVDSLKYDYVANSINEEFIEEFQKNTSRQITHLTTTLKEFRDFYRPDTDLQAINISKTVNTVLLLLKDEFMKLNIDFYIKIQEDIIIAATENDFKHLFINLFNNAKDAYRDNNIKSNKKITINLYKNKSHNIIEVQDNAGGIPDTIIDDIFELNFTTKSDQNGTGVGLHLCQEIIEKYNGKITVNNENNGAKFIINLPK